MAPLYKETDDFELGRCWCFTLRRGVLYFVIGELIISFVCFLSIITDDLRPAAGGYSPYGRITVAGLGLLGLVIGFTHGKLGVFDASAERRTRPASRGYGRITVAALGLLGLVIGFTHGKLGVFDASAERLEPWLYFIYFKLVVTVLIFASDIGLLLTCKGSPPAGFPTIAAIKQAGTCDLHLILAAAFLGVKLLWCGIGIPYTRLLVQKWADGIRYRINFNRDPWFISDKSFQDTTSYLSLERGATV